MSFRARDGTRLSGWLYRPLTAPAHAPAIVMSHGFTAIIDQGLAPFAEAFAEAGFIVLAYDHRGYGRSDGAPRQETDPFQQMHDMRDAITCLSLLPGVDEDRIGLWGASYSGGHALVVAAVDRRVRCVVSVVPLTSGSETIKRLAGEGNLDARRKRMVEARKSEMSAGDIQYQPHAAPGGESIAWFQSSDPEGRWVNQVSVLSHDMLGEYEPGDYIHRIAPTPLLMILADHDLRCCTDLQLAAYERARETKQLLIFEGGHYEAYERHQPMVAAESAAWFKRHLQTTPAS
jgi:cephalosporin-C deacetylase-like acetyl esterase